MDRLLYLVHRIPFPPNKGDKIRSFHLLRHLSQRFNVCLGAFVDDPQDWQYAPEVKKLCDQTFLAKLDPVRAKVKSLPALAANRALTLDYYRDAGMQKWVDDMLQDGSISHVVVFSSAMAQYVENVPHVKRIIDFVDIDSDKWTQYSETKKWPMSWLYRREGKKLLQYERKIASRFDASLFVSQAEATLFKQISPENTNKVSFFNNGVDMEYFSANRDYVNPYPKKVTPIVFAGAMDYWPNIDAVEWFATKIFPAVQRVIPNAIFYIVGSRPAPAVSALASSMSGVIVTGTVPDIRPYVAHAQVSVAPLRIARGIQNKVLEAMAMSKRIVVTPQALEGIDAVPGEDLMLAKTADDFIAAVISALTQTNESFGKSARQCVENKYDWTVSLGQVDKLLEPYAKIDPASPKSAALATMSED